MTIALKSTAYSVQAATDYLSRRNALHKLSEPVICLFACPHHGADWRERRSRRINAFNRSRLSLWSEPPDL